MEILYVPSLNFTFIRYTYINKDKEVSFCLLQIKI